MHHTLLRSAQQSIIIIILCLQEGKGLKLLKSIKLIFIFNSFKERGVVNALLNLTEVSTLKWYHLYT